MNRRRFVILLLLAAAGFILGACGTSEDIFGSLNGIPNAGVSPWRKVDLDPETDLIQPYVLFGDNHTVLTEPCYLIVDGRHYLFYEAFDALAERRVIYLAAGDSWLTLETINDGLPVLEADRIWEAGSVGAPAVLHRDDRFLMWYAGGEGAGLGLARSDDGLTWRKNEDNPVLTPEQTWEGGEAGIVAAPSVVHHDGKYRMYYSAGRAGGPALQARAGRAIGYATSPDGIVWEKYEDNPVLVADQPWEGWEENDDSAGWVSSPSLLIEHPAERDVYRLYYTGNLTGDPLATNASIGYAGSYDGVEWTKASVKVNPVLSELFSLTLPGLSEYLLYSEFAPSVLNQEGVYRMVFGQFEPLLTAQGLGIAYNDGNWD